MVTTKKTLNFLIFNIILMVVFISCGTESGNTNTDSIDQPRIIADTDTKADADAKDKADADAKAKADADAKDKADAKAKADADAKAKADAEAKTKSDVKDIFEDLDLIKKDNNYGDWPKYIDVETLRIFSSSEVTNQYLLKVAAIYKLMFADSNLIDNELQNMFFKTIQDENIYQRIVYIGVHSDDRVAEVFRNRACCPGGDYQKNYADIIWEEDVELNSQLAEILEHQIHTITHVAFRLMHEDWDYKNPNSALRKSYQEAVDKNLFNAKSYEDRKYGDINEFYRVVTQEYIFWVIATEWDFRSVWKIPHKEFEIVNKKDIADKLPQSHKLYEEFVAKILTPPDRKLVENILKYNPVVKPIVEVETDTKIKAIADADSKAKADTKAKADAKAKAEPIIKIITIITRF